MDGTHGYCNERKTEHFNESQIINEVENLIIKSRNRSESDETMGTSKHDRGEGGNRGGGRGIGLQGSLQGV